MNEQQIPGQDPAAVPAKTTNVNVYEQPAATTASSGVNIQTIAIIAAVVIAVIMLINMIS